MTASTSVRVLLVEDNDVYRSSLELLLGLQRDVELLASASTGAQAIAEAERARPDVALVDFRLPDMSGEKVTAALRRISPQIAVVCLTAEISPEERDAVIAAGAAEVAEKGQSIEQLLAVIHRAAGATR